MTGSRLWATFAVALVCTQLHAALGGTIAVTYCPGSAACGGACTTGLVNDRSGAAPGGQCFTIGNGALFLQANGTQLSIYADATCSGTPLATPDVPLSGVVGCTASPGVTGSLYSDAYPGLGGGAGGDVIVSMCTQPGCAAYCTETRVAANADNARVDLRFAGSSLPQTLQLSGKRDGERYTAVLFADTAKTSVWTFWPNASIAPNASAAACATPASNVASGRTAGLSLKAFLPPTASASPDPLRLRINVCTLPGCVAGCEVYSMPASASCVPALGGTFWFTTSRSGPNATVAMSTNAFCDPDTTVGPITLPRDGGAGCVPFGTLPSSTVQLYIAVGNAPPGSNDPAPVAVIIGATVGCVVGLLLICGLMCWGCRQKAPGGTAGAGKVLQSGQGPYTQPHV